ncbi:MAG: type 1 glutamine amidotransferase [bacterium]|nr:type 1 glutamine amidotransferase [bacterium]
MAAIERLRFLLLQIRELGDPVIEEERDSFAEKAGLAVEQILLHNLLDGPPTHAEVRACDGLLVGGSGDYYVSKGHMPGFDELMRFFVQVADRGYPTFASCFGFQLLVQALGGQIVHDPANTELGTLELSLTEAGRDDPLMETLPPTFNAQLGHKDRAERLPPGFENLASGPRCEFQAFRVPNKPIWATQFHPELDGHTNRGRYLRYLEGYAEHLSPEERELALENYRDSYETEQLLKRFIELVFN